MPHPWKGIRPWKRHSLVLAVAGLVYILIGISYIIADLPESRAVALQIAIHWWSIPRWGIVFAMAGVLSILSSRWPPVSETWGYFVLTGLSAGWSAFYLTAVIFKDSPAANLSGTLSWGLIGFLWWAISGLVNPDVVIELKEENAVLRARNEALERELERCGRD